MDMKSIIRLLVAFVVVLQPHFQAAVGFSMPEPGAAAQSRTTRISGQPPYSLASADISAKWIDLVTDGKVEATVTVLESDASEVPVRYGVRFVEKKDGIQGCQDFVEEAGLQPGQRSTSKLVQSINQTLESLQKEESEGNTIKFGRDGNFVAQLQLVRTLRPPPSPGFAGSASSVPPSYDASTDSFVTGPLRLELRPKVASLYLNGMCTAWDVFHNVSPADSRGHFLLLPTIDDMEKNWRGQIFKESDCNDMVHLVHSVEPVGSLFLGYNSVGGAASQNHIHCHAWPSPPMPLQHKPPGKTDAESDPTNGGVSNGWDCYAVSNVDSVYDFYDVEDGNVEISYLKYPVFCVQLSASEQNLGLLGKSLAACLNAIGDAPYNVGFLNRLQANEDTDELERYSDVYVFARSKERSSIIPSLKLGISEMMGLFHPQSDDELELLTKGDNSGEGPMYQALSDVSYGDEEDLWETIKANLEHLSNKAVAQE